MIFCIQSPTQWPMNSIYPYSFSIDYSIFIVSIYYNLFYIILCWCKLTKTILYFGCVYLGSSLDLSKNYLGYKTFFIHHNVLVNSGILKSLSWKCMLVPYKSWPAVFSQASIIFFAHHHVMSVLVFSPRWLNPPQQKCFYISITLCSSLFLTITF